MPSTFTVHLLTMILALGGMGANRQKQADTSSLSLEAIAVTGSGPYSVKFVGTVIVDGKSQAFIGAKMIVLDANGKWTNTVVNFPNAGPKPGQSRPVQFSVDLPSGKFTGLAEMLFTDSNGNLRTLECKVSPFKIPGDKPGTE